MKEPKPKKIHNKFIPFNYPIIRKKKLDRNFEKKNLEFLDVLLTRRSTNKFDVITLKQIAELLFYSNKIESLNKDDYNFISTKRTAPSAGGRHPIDLLISLPKENSTRILEYYNPIDHSLNELNISEVKMNPFFLEINKNIPIKNSCIIWFSIQTNKTKTKYENCESLYWKDAGALLYCIQLISNYMGLKSCPLGGLSSDCFHNIFESNNLISGGGILVGA